MVLIKVLINGKIKQFFPKWKIKNNKIRTTLFLRQSLEIGGFWKKYLCVYVQYLY